MIGRTPEPHPGHPAAEGRRHRRLRDLREDAPLLHPEGAPAAAGSSPAWSSACRRASPASSSAPCRRPPSTPAPASPPTSSRSPWPRPSAPACPVQEPTGNMIVDIGGGTTEVAVISLGGIVASQSVRVGGDELDDAIIQFIKKEYSLALGERTAEEVKIALGSAWPLEEELHAEIRGRDLVTGLPEDDRHHHRGDPRGDRGAGGGHRRRREGHARQDAARAGRRHHGAGHRARRRRRAAARARRAARARDRHADLIAPNPLHSVGDRLGPVARGVRGAEGRALPRPGALRAAHARSSRGHCSRRPTPSPHPASSSPSLVLITFDSAGQRRHRRCAHRAPSMSSRRCAAWPASCSSPVRQRLARLISTTTTLKQENDRAARARRGAGRRRDRGRGGQCARTQELQVRVRPAHPGPTSPGCTAEVDLRRRRRTSTRRSRSTRASRKGIQVGMPVITSAGLVGRIVQVTDRQRSCASSPIPSSTVGVPVRQRPVHRPPRRRRHDHDRGAAGRRRVDHRAPPADRGGRDDRAGRPRPPGRRRWPTAELPPRGPRGHRARPGAGPGSGRPLEVEQVNARGRACEGDGVITSGVTESLFPPDIPVGRVQPVERRPGSLDLLESASTPRPTSTGCSFVQVLLYDGDACVLQGLSPDAGGPRHPWFRVPVVIAVVVVTVQTVVIVARSTSSASAPTSCCCCAVAGGLVGGPQRGAVAGFVVGLVYDLVLTTPFGLSALVLLPRRLRGRPDPQRGHPAQRWLPTAIVFLASGGGGRRAYAGVATVFGLRRASSRCVSSRPRWSWRSSTPCSRMPAMAVLRFAVIPGDRRPVCDGGQRLALPLTCHPIVTRRPEAPSPVGRMAEVMARRRDERAAARGARDRGHVALRRPLRPALVPAGDVAGAAGPAGADLPGPHGAAAADARPHRRPRRDWSWPTTGARSSSRSTGRRSAAQADREILLHPPVGPAADPGRGPRRPATTTSSTTRTCRCRWPRTSDETIAIYLGERREDYPGVEVSEGWQRVYRYAPLASHIVGYMGAIPDTRAPRPTGARATSSNERVGKAGIEEQYEGQLRGKPGLRSRTRSTPATASSGRSAGATRCRATTSQLTIDLQAPAVRRADAAAGPAGGADALPVRQLHPVCGGPAFAAPAGLAVVEDPRNGEILAMATYPTFDNRWFVGGHLNQKIQELYPDADKQAPLVNRAVSRPVPDGLDVQARSRPSPALQSGHHHARLRPTTTRAATRSRTATSPSSSASSRTPAWPQLRARSTWPRRSPSRPSTSTSTASARSCSWTQNPTLQNVARQFGFGADSGIDLPGEIRGRCPTPS